MKKIEAKRHKCLSLRPQKGYGGSVITTILGGQPLIIGFIGEMGVRIVNKIVYVLFIMKVKNIALTNWSVNYRLISNGWSIFYRPVVFIRIITCWISIKLLYEEGYYDVSIDRNRNETDGVDLEGSSFGIGGIGKALSAGVFMEKVHYLHFYQEVV